jgi:hypothetical protein
MGGPEFDITIGKDGRVVCKVHGVSGTRCIELTDMLREIVGKEESRDLTPEYYGQEGHVRHQSSVHGRTQ